MLKKKSQVDAGSATGKSPKGEGDAASNVLRLSRFGTLMGAADSDLRSTFTLPTNYQAYVVSTNEKALLHKELARAYWAGELPIRPDRLLAALNRRSAA